MESLKFFFRVVDGIYGVYLDSVHGFVLNQREATQMQKYSLVELERDNPNETNLEYLDSLPIFFSKIEPTDPQAVIQHQCTQKQYKERNDKNGFNHKIIGRMCVVNIYQYWEAFFREEIAREFKIKRGDFKDPVMGDLRIIRNSIIHHAGIALPEIKDCQVFKWFSKGDEIIIDDDKMEEIVRKIKSLDKRIFA